MAGIEPDSSCCPRNEPRRFRKLALEPEFAVSLLKTDTSLTWRGIGCEAAAADEARVRPEIPGVGSDMPPPVAFVTALLQQEEL